MVIYLQFIIIIKYYLPKLTHQNFLYLFYSQTSKATTQNAKAW